MAHQSRVDIKNVDQKDDDKGMNDWLNELYNIDGITDEEMNLWNEAYQYKGFNKKQVLKELKEKIPEPKIVQQIVLVCGMQGPQRASLVKLMNGKTIASYGIPASGMKGSKGVSCQRITSATADLCAYMLKKINFPKRILSQLPGWLQFPGAGSITLPDDLRLLHIDFSRKFSVMIGGVFNEQIYQQMMTNSYIDQRLHLFDDYTQSMNLMLTPTIPTPVTATIPIGSSGRTRLGAEKPKT